MAGVDESTLRVSPGGVPRGISARCRAGLGDAFNKRDALPAAALYHHDAVNTQVAARPAVSAARQFWRELLAFFRAFPDNYTRPVNLSEDGEWGTLEWTGGGTPASPPGDIIRCERKRFEESEWPEEKSDKDLIHSHNPRTWIKELKTRLSEPVNYAEASN